MYGDVPGSSQCLSRGGRGRTGAGEGDSGGRALALGVKLCSSEWTLNGRNHLSLLVILLNFQFLEQSPRLLNQHSSLA